VRQRKTDYGTIFLHWLLVAAIGVAFVSGLRIATETPSRTWINLFDALLPRANVWTLHMEAAVALFAIAVAYAVYVTRSGLSRRIQLDKIRLRALIGRKQSRLGAVSVLLSWFFFLFWPARGPKRGGRTLVGELGSSGLHLPAYSRPDHDRRDVAASAYFPSRTLAAASTSP
jgi:hypothetical protein